MSKGQVTVELFRGRLRLRWRWQKKRQTLTIGADTEMGRAVANQIARSIEADILTGNYDESRKKYRVDVDRQDDFGTVIDEGTSVEVENLEPIDEEIEVLKGFEAISRDFIKVFARKHSRQISDDIAHHFNLDDKSILYDNVFTSIVKTLIDYREEVQSAL